MNTIFLLAPFIYFLAFYCHEFVIGKHLSKREAVARFGVCDAETCFVTVDKCKSTPSKKYRYYYNENTSKCEQTDKCYNGTMDVNDETSNLFVTMKDCENDCKLCAQLLQQHKVKDGCLLWNLKFTQIYGHQDEHNLKNETFWVFYKREGKCISIGGQFPAEFKGPERTIFTTKEECDKRCPPRQA